MSSHTVLLRGASLAMLSLALACPSTSNDSIPSITSFTATPSSLVGAGSTTLSWVTTGATELSIDQGIGPVTGTSVLVPSIAATTTFTLTATNTSGNAVASTTVSVMPLPLPVISAFSATPLTLGVNGGVVTLSWTVTGADSLSLSPGGAVTGTGTTVTIAATTTFTLTATNASGLVTSNPVTVTVPVAADRYADSTHGLDTNDCSQAAPCLTIAKAMSLASSGHSVVLFDGTYDTATQPDSAVAIPDGVALRALNAGAATVSVGPLNVAGSSTIDGIVLGPNASIAASSSTGTPTLVLNGILFTRVGALSLGGDVQATMTPGSLAESTYSQPLTGTDPLIALAGAAALIIQGGVFNGNSGGGGNLIECAGTSLLTLNNAIIQSHAATAIALVDSAAVQLENDAQLFSVSEGIQTGGANSVSLSDSQISTATVGIFVTSTPNVPIITLTNSLLTGLGNATNAASYGILSDQGGADALLILDNATITDTYNAIRWGGGAATSFDIKKSTMMSNGSGVQFHGLGTIKVRSSDISNNFAFAAQCPTCSNGLQINTAATADLGTQADPGLNTFTGNGGTGVYLFNDTVNLPANTTVNAVGNTWIADGEGADGDGHYSIAPGFVPVPAGPVPFGPSGSNTAVNYVIDPGSTMNL